MRIDTQEAVPTAELIAECRAELERLRRTLAGDPTPPGSTRLARVERALSWLGSGHYGYCGVCRSALDADSLRRQPDRLVCDACSRRPAKIESASTTPAW